MGKRKPPTITDDFDETQIPDAIMEEARERVIREAAMAIARREMGIVDDDDGVAPPKGVKRGPPASFEREPKVEITLDLAEHSDRIVIDSKIYLQGATYTVPQSLANTMREIIARGWEHQREIDGKDRNVYRKQANLILGPKQLAVAPKDIIAAAAQA